jgi:hypothetical protein
VTNICDNKNSWKIFLNYAANTIDITLIDGGTIPNETRSLFYSGLSNYAPYWKLGGNAPILIKYLGGNGKPSNY